MTAIDTLKYLLAKAESEVPEGHQLIGLYVPVDIVREIIDAQPEQQWIPFESRPLTEEEKADHPYWSGILSGHLPDNGQRILVSIQDARHEHVQVDDYYDDDGCYLDSGYDIGTEATAWMPLPEPYKVGRNE